MALKSWPLLLASILTTASVQASSAEPLLNGTYDYVIVGGGTSGLTVADRLTENGKRTTPFSSPCVSTTR
jgi:ribulose 1,5-bisphosphate synthetase/thiazole synthase